MTTTPTPTLAIILGSIRPDRFGPMVADWFAAEARQHEAFDVNLIDLADYKLPMELAGNDPEAAPPPNVAKLGRRLAKADAFVIVTPVYNRSYPASLKTAIDWFYGEWVLRPVSFLSYGGATGGLTAIEHLRGVFPEFPAVTTKSFISLPNFWKTFDHDGRPMDAEGLRAPATAVLDELAWWAPMLREARKARTYPGLDFELTGNSDSVASAEDLETDSARNGHPAAEDEAAILEIVADIELAFNSKDPDGLVRHISEDAVVVNPLGHVMRGREEVLTSVTPLMNEGPLAEATAHYRLTDLTMLSPEVAVGHKSAWSSAEQAEDGEHPEMNALYVFLRRGGRWRVVRRQNTLVSASAPADSVRDV